MAMTTLQITVKHGEVKKLTQIHAWVSHSNMEI